MHLAHPLGVKAFAYRRVKNDVRDATDLADLLRMGRLPEAWIAPPATRELRELVRHRAKLVALRSHCKAEVHAVLAKCGIQVPMTRPVRRRRATSCWTGVTLPGPVRGPGAVAAAADRRPGLRDRPVRRPGPRPAGRADPGYLAIQQIPGVGPVLAAVFVAEIGDVTRFHRPRPQLACWAGLTPKHHESDTNVHRGRITKQGSRLVRWAAVESVKRVGPHHGSGRLRDRVADRRGRNIGAVAAAREQIELVFYALRDHHVRALHPPAPADGGMRRPADPPVGREVVQVMTPTPAIRSARSLPLIDPDRPRNVGAPHHAAASASDLHGGPRGEGMTEQPPGLLPPATPALMRAPSTKPLTTERTREPNTTDPDNREQRAPNGDGVKALRPLRGRAPPEP